MTPVNVLGAFFAGMLSFLSPCVLPLVPAYLSMVSGVSVDELAAPKSDQRRKVLRGTLLFLAGFTIVFVLLGAGASAIGQFLKGHKREFEVVSGVFVIAMGVFMLGFVRPKFLESDRRFRIADSVGGWAAPLMGGAFAFGWTPCIGPTLGFVMGLAANANTVAAGIGLLLVYSLGLGVPFVLSGLALSELTRVFGWVKRHFRAVELVAGGLMVVFGLLLITNQLTRLSLWATKVMDALGLDWLTVS